jgi:hypothetical protein
VYASELWTLGRRAANALTTCGKSLIGEEEEVIVVAAKQTFGSSGPTVTVQSQAVNPDPVSLSSPYMLTLPVGEPLLGQYVAGGTLPIPLTAQTAPAGRYTVEASATGYQTPLPSPVDISTMNATQNFTLAP